MKQVYTYTDTASTRFWNIEVDDCEFIVNYGKLGTRGRIQAKEFLSEEECQRAVDRLIEKRIKDGYREQGKDIMAKLTNGKGKPVTSNIKKMLDKRVLFNALDRDMAPADLCSLLFDLLREGADPKARDDKGNTFLHRLVVTPLGGYGGKVINAAVKNGANINAYNIDGHTPLMKMVSEGRIDQRDILIEQLIAAGADVNIQDFDGSTALHLSKCLSLDCYPILCGKPNLLHKNAKGISVFEHLNGKGYYSEGSALRIKIKALIDDLLPKIIAVNPTAGYSWNPHTIDLSKAYPKKLEILSSHCFSDNVGVDGFFHIHGNMLGILSGYHPNVLDVFDTQKGEVVLRVKHCARLGGHALYDNGVLFVGHDAGEGIAACVTAHDLESAKELWKCKLTNIPEQFGTRMVQTADMVIAPCVKSDKLFFIDKETGRLVKNLKMENPFRGGPFIDEDVVFVQNNKLYVLAYKSKKNRYVIDCYDTKKCKFEATIFEFPEKIWTHQVVQVNGYLYAVLNSGMFYKISLAEGRLESKMLLGKEEGENAYSCAKKIQHCGDKLKIMMYHYKSGVQTKYTYNLLTDLIEQSLVIPEIDEDYKIEAPTAHSNVIIRYGYGEPSKNGLSLYDLNSKKTLSELVLPIHGGGEYWRRRHLVLGDSIYLIQSGSPLNEEESCMLHRIG